ncbi:septum formation initiator [Erythrobacter sp. 3-20A1M]|uniref:FtsB family cell division protein n=1 Tax=Erythrobacter sp. 3-20A1M TaxID=2653850 RepID=UPI001BFCB0EC|nr:septum formation initiator family protein [Erythrobacter sp. 3-20A1M]QWC58492.1 septum formation initiator [Erythrobacter sp. 3-20A1M]
MTREGHKLALPREQFTQGLALVVLLALAGLSLMGPDGVLAWGENARLLDQRKARIEALEERRSELQSQVAALDPDHADPDMVSELLRKNLNVVRPDEVILPITNP